MLPVMGIGGASTGTRDTCTLYPHLTAIISRLLVAKRVSLKGRVS